MTYNQRFGTWHHIPLFIPKKNIQEKKWGDKKMEKESASTGITIILPHYFAARTNQYKILIPDTNEIRTTQGVNSKDLI